MLDLPGTTLPEVNNRKNTLDSSINLNDVVVIEANNSEHIVCNGFTTPQQSSTRSRVIDNSIFNTISKIVNPNTKVTYFYIRMII